ncbi:uncharacterized protein E0L32_003779 [Thyridium curvatum]|uniref:BTB domain-containing protein n=1 Tax=Thyridium curvatum TaxID=1093900 RepID=A0A507B069_9PEZI|nr:uncharacterized protein E0L32_003779 [Thyridium curvatum]TPX16485.1 hypothetical protein E0L32_003779 [Thyridium curvatum]
MASPPDAYEATYNTQAVVLRSPRERMAAYDHELLETGAYADIEVVCGNRTWHVHRAILCMRCPWFDHKLGPYVSKPSEKTTIQLKESVEHVEWLMGFIYTGVCHPPQLEEEEFFFTTCIALYDLGAKFSLVELVDHALALLETHCSRQVTVFHDMARSSPRGFVDHEYLHGLLAGLEIAYKHELHRRRVRRILVDFIYLSQTWFLNSQPFLDYLHKRPKFGMDLLCKRTILIRPGGDFAA